MTGTRSTEADHYPGLSRSRVLVVVGSYFALSGVLQAFIPLRASAMGGDGAVLGLLLVLAGGGIGLVTDMGFGAYADAHGRDKVVFGGFFCILIAVSLIVLDGSRQALLAGCFLAGLGNSAVFDPLLALLTTTPHHQTQARTQGFNVATQRCGALLSALMIGVALATRRDEILALTAVVACLAALAVMCSRCGRPWRYWMSPFSGEGPRLGQLLARGYRQGFEMLRRRRIVMAALVSVAVNLIFIETNSFVPLIDRQHGLKQAVVVTAALCARDLTAIVVGVWTVTTGRHASSPLALVGVFLLAAICAACVGLDAVGSHRTLILWCALQGVAVGVGVAAMNLLTVGASSEGQRALGMAAATLINRLGVVVLPLALGLTLQLWGLRAVFFAVGAALTALCLGYLVVGLGDDARPTSAGPEGSQSQAL